MSVLVRENKRRGCLMVDIRIRLPDGTRYRERAKAPVQSKSGAVRWGEERARFLSLQLDPKTVNDVLGVLSTMLKTAVEWKEIGALPCTIKPLKRDTNKAPRFYDFDDYERLVEGAEKSGKDVFASVLLGGEAGLCRGEMVALEWPDVDFKRNQIIVARADWEGQIGAPKGGKTRRVPMTTRLAAALQAIRHLRGSRVRFQADGSAVTADTLRSWMQRATKRAGTKESNDIHILRHTFCSHLAMRGAPARAIQELAGHADLNTTMRYMHLSPASVNNAIKLLELRGNGGATEVVKK